MIKFQKELFQRIYLATKGNDSHRVIVKYFTRDPSTEFRIVSNLKHPNLIQYLSLYYEKAPALAPCRWHNKRSNSEEIDESTQNNFGITPVGESEQVTLSDAIRPRAIVMEYCPRGDLYEYLMNHTLTVPVVQNIFRQLANVLLYLHQHDIAHRDVKLENIFLRDEPIKENSLVLGDFELMSRWHPDRTLTQTVGTLYYQAPELFSSHRYLGPELDVWSTGVVIYTLLTGSFPFHNDDDSIAIHHILNTPLYLPSSLPKSAQELLLRMLDKNQTTRISMNQVVEHPFLKSS